MVSRTAISSHSGIQRLRDTSGGLIETTMLSYSMSTNVSGLPRAQTWGAIYIAAPHFIWLHSPRPAARSR